MCHEFTFFRIRALLVPPKPKELERTRSIGMSTVVLAMLRLRAFSLGSSRLMLGATKLSRIMMKL